MANKTKNLKLVNDSKYRGNQNWSWNVWLESAERQKIQEKIDSIGGVTSEYTIYRNIKTC